MPRINKFSGVKMSFAVVNLYYPVNANYPNFARFVFQQMIDDGNNSVNDDYTLIAYAVNANGTVINSCPLTPSNANPVIARQKVHFANMKLELDNLKILYPPGGTGTSEVRVYPSGYYGTTNYVVYTAETDNGTGPLTTITQTINPSPPA